MDNHRRNSIIEPSGGYGPDARNQMNTTTIPPKAQQRAPAPELSSRPRPEFYQQGPPHSTSNRPPGQQQQGQQQQRPQQQQQPRTPGDKVSPWNLLRQALPPDVIVRGQQRPPPSPQYYNMQQRPPPPPPQDQQPQYRQQPPQQDRRAAAPFRGADDRQPPPFRPENGRLARPAGGGGGGGGGGDDDEEVVVNSSVNQQPPPPPPPPLNRRDSTLYAGATRTGEGIEPNRQWQRLAAVATAAQGQYGKPPQDQQYGRQPLAIADGHEQRYGRQEDDGRRPPQPPPNGALQKPRDAQPVTRRDSVLMDASRRNDEYGRRPPPSDLQEEGNGRLPRVAAEPLQIRRPPPPPQESQEDGGRRPAEYKKMTEPNDYGKSMFASRPAADVNKDDRVSPQYNEQQQQQQPRYERKAEKEHVAVVKTMEHGNRASELRKSHFEATHPKPAAKEQNQYSKAALGGGSGGGGGDKTPTRVEETATRARDYVAKPTGDPYEPEGANVVADNYVRSEMFAPPSKNSRPDTLKIIQDNEPLRDSSNSKGNYRSDIDVGKSPSKIPKKDRSELKTPTRAMTPKSPDSAISVGQKRLPMNKVQVGSAPSPNLKVVQSKVGSLQNTSHKPGGGQVKIENRKLEWKAGTRIVAKNDTYVPGGGDKKIQSVKLQWNAKPKVGSLENKTHKPGGGDKKIETVKLDFKDKAKPKIGSKDNIKHTPGGGAVKIEDQKLEIKAQSKVGSLDNVKHKPGGGEVKIFDDKSYIKQTTGQIGTPTKSQLRRSSSLKSPTTMKFFSPEERPKSQVKIVVTPTSEEDLYTKIGTDTTKGGFRRSANNRSPLLQNNIVIPEEAVRPKNDKT